ncbi:MAG: sulfite exporter TauE/SafE family protein [Chloroflexi bacterium]|nr:sulfite exporter TauE/SafE family protein [Chloroflexota bacterium]
MDIRLFLGLCILVFLVASLYSSVGHGGASGYLAVLSLFAFTPREMASAALLLNILVAGTAFLAFWRAGHFSSRLTWPFLLASVPGAFLGGLARASPVVYAYLLAAVLVFAAVRLFVAPRAQEAPVEIKAPSLAVGLPIGGGIGALSGVVGVGGGIFLSPLILLLRWADPKATAASSALFIVVNSVSGLLGRWVGGTIELGLLALLLLPAFAGGLLGSYLGARWFSGVVLRRLLGVALLAAAAKLLLSVLR